MNNNKNRIAGIFMAGAILSSTITPTVLAVENTNESIESQESSVIENQNIKITKLSETDSYQLEGNLNKNTEYQLVIGDDIRETVQTDINGMFALNLTEVVNLNLEDQLKLLSMNEEVIIEGRVEEFYAKEENEMLQSPEINHFDSSESLLSGYNHSGEVLVVNVNSDTVLTYDISTKNEFSIHIDNEIQSEDILSVYVENSNGDRSDVVEVQITTLEEMESIEEAPKVTDEKGVMSEQVSEDDTVIDDSKSNTIVASSAKSVLEVSTSSSTFSTQVSDNPNEIDLSKEPLGKKYHFVQPNETLYSLAKVYDTTVDHILAWNDMKDASELKSGLLISVDGIDNYDNISKETKVFSSNQDFLNYISPQAEIIAKEYNLYTSVMVAQALHESSWGRSRLATIGNNLFGVKGSYNGNSIVMLTWEEINGEIVWVQEAFRLYPTFYESIVDNAVKLRYGVSWNKNFYSGTWVENTASHMDSTDWLTGRYATDSRYDIKVNNTIKYYNLTKHDKHITITNPIISQQYLNREVYLKNDSTKIYTQPYGTASFKEVSRASSHAGKLLTVKQEKVNDLGKWYSLFDGSAKIGWINESAISQSYYSVTKTTSSKYSGAIVKPWSINTAPWGTVNAKKVVSDGTYVGQSVNVIEEKTTDKAVYALIEINGKTIGWVDNSAIEKNTEVIATYDRYYGAQVTKPVTVYFAPYGTTGSNVVTKDSYDKEMIIVTQEKETKNGIYSLITKQNKEIGWVSKDALNKAKVLETKKVDYTASVHESVNVYSLPWGLDGFKLVSTTEKQVHSNLSVKEEKATQFGNYALVYSGTTRLGWVEKDKLDLNPILNTKQANYKAVVSKPWSINTLPWGTFGYRTVDSGESFIGQTVDVIEEKTTPRSVYALIQRNGKTLGWIDTTGIEKYRVLSTTDKTYSATVIKPWSINSAPWGTENASLLYDGADYVGKEVVVTREKVTQRGTYALVKSNGKELGWIDTTGITSHEIQSEKNVNYVATITKPWSVNTEPWGVKGFKTVISDSRLVGETVNVIKESKTPRSSFVLLEQNGKVLGWIDETGVQKDHSISSHTDISYNAVISRPWSINSKPYGSDGYKRVAEGKEYMDKEVTVLAEQITDRSTYVLIQHNGKEIGWIDITGITPHRVLSEKKTDYTVTITKPWSINTLPWGIRGFEQVDTGQTYLNKEVKVIAEQKTPRSTYLLVEHNGKQLGWIDFTGTKR